MSVLAVDNRGAVNTQMDWSGVRERHRSGGGRASSPWPWAVSIPDFRTVLASAEIAEVEAQFGVALPDEYRTSLAEVGAGGPGPALELTSLRRIDRRWGWVWESDEDHPWLLGPSGPFVETEDWADQQIATLRAAGYESTTRDEDDDYLDDYRKVFGDAGDEVWHLERGRGAIHISDNGRGMTGWLIVLGPHRGELRDLGYAVNPPFEPYVDTNGNRHTFRSWYLEWLEQRGRAARWSTADDLHPPRAQRPTQPFPSKEPHPSSTTFESTQ
ncbi:SMI1/KNR4 family protein [Streptomyces sp. T1317-0309]|nr:SMI1/KNR4 family protein [Streptomyces sp. T1317-0309]